MNSVYHGDNIMCQRGLAMSLRHRIRAQRALFEHDWQKLIWAHKLVKRYKPSVETTSMLRWRGVPPPSNVGGIHHHDMHMFEWRTIWPTMQPLSSISHKHDILTYLWDHQNVSVCIQFEAKDRDFIQYILYRLLKIRQILIKAFLLVLRH